MFGRCWTQIWPSEATTVVCTDQSKSPNSSSVTTLGIRPQHALPAAFWVSADNLPLRLRLIALLSGSADKQKGGVPGWKQPPVRRQTFSDYF